MSKRGIAVSGKQGAGKSSIVRALDKEIARRGRLTLTVSFAEPVKSLSKAVLVDLGLVTPTAAEADWKYRFRTTPQTVGEHLRGYDPEVWVNLALARIDKAPHNVVVLNDDCRHPNEAEALRKAGLYLVRIEADRDLRLQRLGELKNETHRSEVGLDNWRGWDLVIPQSIGSVQPPEAYADLILQRAGVAGYPRA